MLRLSASLSLLALLVWSCGPDDRIGRTCAAKDPDFIAVVQLGGRPLPPDLVVRVTYAGSAKEEFRLSDQKATHEVAFCETADVNGVPLEASTPPGGAAGAGGAESESPAEDVRGLYCRLWTSGFTQLEVSGTGFDTQTFDLTPDTRRCTVEAKIDLDPPDAG